MSTTPAQRGRPRTTVAMLCGFWPHVTTEAARSLLAGHPGLELLHYETPRPGALTRTGSGDIPVGDDPVDALLADLNSAVRGQGGSGLLVILPESFEPDQVRAAWHAHRAPGALQLITVVPADLVLDGLTDETALRTTGSHQTGNHRAV